MFMPISSSLLLVFGNCSPCWCLYFYLVLMFMDFYVVFSPQGCNFGMCTSMAKKCPSSTCKWNNVPGIFFTCPKFFISGKKCLIHCGNILSTRITKRLLHIDSIHVREDLIISASSTGFQYSLSISGASKTCVIRNQHISTLEM